MATTLNYGWDLPNDREQLLEVLLRQVLIDIDADLKAAVGTTYAANVTNSAAISIANATATVLTFDTERRDDGGLHSLGSNTDRLTAPVDGWYALTANVEFASNATGFRTISFRKNGSAPGDIIWAAQANAVSGTETILQLSREAYLNAGDFIRVYAYQNSGAPLNATKAGQYSPEFGMVKVGR